MSGSQLLLSWFRSLFQSAAPSKPPPFQVIHTYSAPPPIGPYSQAIQLGDFVMTSGQIGLDPYSQEMVRGGIRNETLQALENIKAILQQSNRSLRDVVSTTIYVTNLDHFDTVNEVYADYFQSPFPARTTVQVSRLPKNAEIEISAIAK